MTKKYSAILLALMLALTCACALSEEERDAYSEVGMNETLKELTERYGEPAPEGDLLVFADGFACTFFENGALRVKARVFTDVRDIASLSEADIKAKARSFKQGDSLEYVEAELGAAGAELMRVNISDAENSGVRRVLAWRDADGGALEMLFESEDGGWKLFYVVSVENNMDGDANK